MKDLFLLFYFCDILLIFFTFLSVCLSVCLSICQQLGTFLLCVLLLITSFFCSQTAICACIQFIYTFSSVKICPPFFALLNIYLFLLFSLIYPFILRFFRYFPFLPFPIFFSLLALFFFSFCLAKNLELM